MVEQRQELTQLRRGLIALAIGALAGIGACYLYFWLVPYVPALAPGCALSRATHLYCPGCGGTRAVAALLRGDVVGSFRANPTVLYLVVVAAVLYLRGWWHFWRRKTVFIPVPAWSWIGLIVVAVGVFVARNVLMLWFGIDTLGENLAFWQQYGR